MGRDFCFHNLVWISSGAHPVVVKFVQMALFPGVKWLELKVDHYPPFGVNVWNASSIIFMPYICLKDVIHKHRSSLKNWIYFLSFNSPQILIS